MGICGTGMASLAGMLKEMGYKVTGSDHQIYPPMSQFLESQAIPVMKGYDGRNLASRPDLVIVGNVITRDNPEAVALADLGLPYLSFPQAVGRFALAGKRSIVVSGTHGKTTTSSLAAWVMERAGLNPGFMIGGIPLNFQQNFKIGKGPYFVVEGDEYDTAFFDKGPKFLHYHPRVAIVTSIEFDHADIFRNLDHVVASFRKLIDLMPADGFLIANRDDPVVAKEIARARCPVATYGLSRDAMWKAVDLQFGDDFTRMQVLKGGVPFSALQTPLCGRHNVANLLSIVVLADYLNVPLPALSEALKGFDGVRRRQEVLGEKGGVLVVDDFAHHPTAVRETLEALRERYRNRRLIAVFEPRSNSSRRKVFQEQYTASFDAADLVMIPEPPPIGNIPVEERFSSRSLAENLVKRGLAARYFPRTAPLLEALAQEARQGDVVLFMSNGAFDDLPSRLLKRL